MGLWEAASVGIWMGERIGVAFQAAAFNMASGDLLLKRAWKRLERGGSA